MGWRAQRIVRVLWEGESSSETAGDEIKTPSGDPLMSLGELPPVGPDDLERALDLLGQ